jgi:hypothetical protein
MGHEPGSENAARSIGQQVNDPIAEAEDRRYAILDEQTIRCIN